MKRQDFLKLASLGLLASAIDPRKLFAQQPCCPPLPSQYIENLIIGSGYGGAVTAYRLGAAGHASTILEMGLDWNKNNGQYKPFDNMVTPTNKSTWLSNTTKAPVLNVATFPTQFTGVLDRVDFDNIKVYHGRGVGGGSLANGGMAVTPKEAYFAEVFPNLSVTDFYTNYFPRARTRLRVNTISETFYQSTEFYQFSRVGEREVQKAGYPQLKVPNVYDFNYMQQEATNSVPRSAFNREVIYGNNYGKNSLDKTYLKMALDTGKVTIKDLHRVEYIEQVAGGRYRVGVTLLNTDGSAQGFKTYFCKRLFVNAGSVATTQLLVRAKALGSLPNLSDEVGKYWGNNGNVMGGRNFVNTAFNQVDPALPLGLGANQSTIPVAGADNWKTTNDGFFAEISPFPFGSEVNTAMYLLINRVPNLGSFSWDTSAGQVNLNWTAANYATAETNINAFIDRMIAVNGGTRATLLFPNNGIDPQICYHPLGGCVLGKATDMYGRVNGHPNLYVLDSSLVPGTIGVNPFLTVTAIAEYALDTILQTDFTS